MIKLKVVLLVAEENVRGKILTIEACKDVVEKFKKGATSSSVHLGTTPYIVGKLVDLEYDEERKVVSGIIEMNMVFTAGGRILQELKTSDGDRVLACDISDVRVDLLPEQKKEDKKNG